MSVHEDAYHYYAADQRHGLARNPLKAIIAPRPIAWVSTISADGVGNLAPYSFFNAMGEIILDTLEIGAAPRKSPGTGLVSEGDAPAGAFGRRTIDRERSVLVSTIDDAGPCVGAC